MKARAERLMPNGIPRYVHCYDNGGKTADRYTIVLTGRYRHKTGGSFLYLGASTYPFHPQGVGTSEESNKQIDYPAYGHLGKKVSFQSLPSEVQRFVKRTYVNLWDLEATP